MESSSVPPSPEERIALLPRALVMRIAATAEALALLEPYQQAAQDACVVVQALCRVSVLGRVQRQVARAAPLAVRLDVAAPALKQKRGRLESCLQFLLHHPGGLSVLEVAPITCCLQPRQLELLAQLLAAHGPGSSNSITSLSLLAPSLGQCFDAGVLAPLDRLESLVLLSYQQADLAALPRSVQHVGIHLPGMAYVLTRISDALEAFLADRGADAPAAAAAAPQAGGAGAADGPAAVAAGAAGAAEAAAGADEEAEAAPAAAAPAGLPAETEAEAEAAAGRPAAAGAAGRAAAGAAGGPAAAPSAAAEAAAGGPALDAAAPLDAAPAPVVPPPDAAAAADAAPAEPAGQPAAQQGQAAAQAAPAAAPNGGALALVALESLEALLNGVRDAAAAEVEQLGTLHPVAQMPPSQLASLLISGEGLGQGLDVALPVEPLFLGTRSVTVLAGRVRLALPREPAELPAAGPAAALEAPAGTAVQQQAQQQQQPQQAQQAQQAQHQQHQQPQQAQRRRRWWRLWRRAAPQAEPDLGAVHSLRALLLACQQLAHPGFQAVLLADHWRLQAGGTGSHGDDVQLGAGVQLPGVLHGAQPLPLPPLLQQAAPQGQHVDLTTGQLEQLLRWHVPRVEGAAACRVTLKGSNALRGIALLRTQQGQPGGAKAAAQGLLAGILTGFGLLVGTRVLLPLASAVLGRCGRAH